MDLQRTTVVLRESNCTDIKLCGYLMVDVLKDCLKIEVYFRYFALFVPPVLFYVRHINADNPANTSLTKPFLLHCEISNIQHILKM